MQITRYFWHYWELLDKGKMMLNNTLESIPLDRRFPKKFESEKNRFGKCAKRGEQIFKYSSALITSNGRKQNNRMSKSMKEI